MKAIDKMSFLPRKKRKELPSTAKVLAAFGIDPELCRYRLELFPFLVRHAVHADNELRVS